MLKRVRERLRHELQLEVEKDSALSQDITSILKRALSEKGKPFHSQSSSFWSDLTFLVAEIFEVEKEKVIPVAIAVELALLAGDIFDDLVDQDNMEEIWSTLTVGETIIVANWIYTKAYSIINQTSETYLSNSCKVKVNQTIAEHIGQACIGQWKEIHSNVFDISEDEYVQCVSLKSGKLVEMVFLAVAALNKQPASSIHLCSEAGMNLGIAIQIENDILDLMSPDKSDLLRLSPSVPLLKALESSREKNDLFESNIKAWLITENELEEHRSTIIRYVKECGALDYSYILFHLYQNRAIHAIDSFADSYYNLSAINKLKQFIGYIGDEDNASSQ
jgi:competence protein ComQ